MVEILESGDSFETFPSLVNVRILNFNEFVSYIFMFSASRTVLFID